MSAPANGRRNGTTEKLARFEADLHGLQESFDDFRAEVRGALNRITETLGSSSQTDWKTLLAVVAIALTLIFGIGGAAVAWVTSNVNQLDVVLQREMRLLDQDTHSRLVALREYVERLDEQLEANSPHILAIQILKAQREAIVERLEKVEVDLRSWRRWSQDDHERLVLPVLERVDARLDDIEARLAALELLE